MDNPNYQQQLPYWIKTYDSIKRDKLDGWEILLAGVKRQQRKDVMITRYSSMRLEHEGGG